ncbi:hypothetical protein QVD17_31470 [Tagetes erecta]|uniref:Uncharacterized protein n=1 Tax=Tagetes erecta TaxID=13708 RepID=A0AAD8K3G1_TARER|nr:hypothetical protein QVD17_31470 [Tagetes erecta]
MIYIHIWVVFCKWHARSLSNYLMQDCLVIVLLCNSSSSLKTLQKLYPPRNIWSNTLRGSKRRAANHNPLHQNILASIHSITQGFLINSSQDTSRTAKLVYLD